MYLHVCAATGCRFESLSTRVNSERWARRARVVVRVFAIVFVPYQEQFSPLICSAQRAGFITTNQPLPLSLCTSSPIWLNSVCVIVRDWFLCLTWVQGNRLGFRVSSCFWFYTCVIFNSIIHPVFQGFFMTVEAQALHHNECDLCKLHGGHAEWIPAQLQRCLHRHGAPHSPAGHHRKLPGVFGRYLEQEASHRHQLLPGEACC